MRLIVRRSLWGAATALVLLLGAACNSPQRGGPPAAVDPPAVDSRFGAAYELLANESPTGPDLLPAIDADTLWALVRYAGGCRDHDFVLRHTLAADTLRLWLFHDDDGDNCEEHLTQRLGLPLPREGRDAGTIELLNPHDDTPHMLRWRR